MVWIQEMEGAGGATARRHEVRGTADRDDEAEEHHVEGEVEERAVPDQAVEADPGEHPPQDRQADEEGEQHPGREARDEDAVEVEFAGHAASPG